MTDTWAGSFDWTLGTNSSKKKIGYNSEGQSNYTAVTNAIRNSNDEYIIYHDTVTAAFDTEKGVVAEVFPFGSTSSYTFRTQTIGGDGPNLINLQRKTFNEFSNYVRVYGKGINGEDICAIATHATKCRSRIKLDYQFDFSLGAAMDSTQTTMKISSMIPSTSGWAQNMYLLIGEEIVKIDEALSFPIAALSDIKIARAQGTSASLNTAHEDYSEVLYLGSYAQAPTDFKEYLRISRTSMDSIPCDIMLYVDDDISSFPSDGFLMLGQEVFQYSSKNNTNKTFQINFRGEYRSELYQHFQGSPVVKYLPVDEAESPSSIYTYGQRQMETALDGLWTRSTADIRAESILQAMAFPREEIILKVGDPLGTYADSSYSTFQYSTKKNLNIIGHMITLNDSDSSLSSASNYRVVRESFYYDKDSGYTLDLTVNNLVDSNYSPSSSSSNIGNILVSPNKFVEQIKSYVDGKSQSTGRTTDFSKKSYMQFDGSGGIATLNSLLRLNTAGLDCDLSTIFNLNSLYFVKTDTEPTKTEGGLYYDGSEQKFKFCNGTDWLPVDSGGGAGGGNISGPSSSVNLSIPFWNSTDGTLLGDMAKILYNYVNGGLDLDTGALNGDSPYLTFFDGHGNWTKMFLGDNIEFTVQSQVGVNIQSTGANDIKLRSGRNILNQLGGTTYLYNFRVRNSTPTTRFQVDADGNIWGTGTDKLYGPSTDTGGNSIGTGIVKTVSGGITSEGASSWITGALVWATGAIGGMLQIATGATTHETVMTLEKAQTVSGIKTFSCDLILDYTAGASPMLIARSGTNDKDLRFYHNDTDGIIDMAIPVGSSNLKIIPNNNMVIKLPDTSGTNYLEISDSADAMVCSINSNGDLTNYGILKVSNAYSLPTADGTSGKVLQTNGSGTVTWENVTVTGTVSGPGEGNSTTNAIAKWADSHGNSIVNSGVIIDGSNNVTGMGTLTVGGTVYLHGSDDYIDSGGTTMSLTSSGNIEGIIHSGSYHFSVKVGSTTLFNVAADGTISHGSQVVYGNSGEGFMNRLATGLTGEAWNVAGSIGVLATGVLQFFDGTASRAVITNKGGQTIGGAFSTTGLLTGSTLSSTGKATLDYVEILATTHSSAPQTTNGTIYYDSALHTFQFRENGSWKSLSSATYWTDMTTYLKPSADGRAIRSYHTDGTTYGEMKGDAGGLLLSSNGTIELDPTTDAKVLLLTGQKFHVVGTGNSDALQVNYDGSAYMYYGPFMIDRGGALKFGCTVNGNYVGFKAPATVTTTRIWTLPPADGTSGQVIQTDGSGNLSFVSGALVGSNWYNGTTYLKPKVDGQMVRVVDNTDTHYGEMLYETDTGGLTIRTDTKEINLISKGTGNSIGLNCAYNGSTVGTYFEVHDSTVAYDAYIRAVLAADGYFHVQNNVGGNVFTVSDTGDTFIAGSIFGEYLNSQLTLDMGPTNKDIYYQVVSGGYHKFYVGSVIGLSVGDIVRSLLTVHVGNQGTTVGTVDIEGSASSDGVLYLRSKSSGGVGTTTLSHGSLTTDVGNLNIDPYGKVRVSSSYYLPDVDGTVGQLLKTDGAGTLSWVTATSTPAGSTTQIQYNNAGALGASPAFTYLTGTLTVGQQNVTRGTVDVNGGASTQGVLYLRGSGTSYGTTTLYHGEIDTDVGNLTLLPAGELILSPNSYVSVSGILRPSSNNSYTLGSSSYRWSTVYGTTLNLSSTVTIGGYTMPSTIGTSGQVLRVPTSGTTLEWVTMASAASLWSDTGVYVIPLNGRYIADGVQNSTAGVLLLNGGTSGNTGEIFINGGGSSYITMSIASNYIQVSSGAMSIQATSLQPSTAGMNLGSATYYYGSLWVNNIYSIGGDLLISPSSNLKIQSHAYPSTTATYDLGTTSYYWRTAYVNDVRASGELDLYVGGTNSIVGRIGSWTSSTYFQIVDSGSGSVMKVDGTSAMSLGTQGSGSNTGRLTLCGGTLGSGQLKIASGTGSTNGTIDCNTWTVTGSVNVVIAPPSGYKVGNGIFYLPNVTGTNGQVLVSNGSTDPYWATIGGTGDVVGPALSTDTCIALFSGTTGKLIMNSVVAVTVAGNISTAGLVTMSGLRRQTVSDTLGTSSAVFSNVYTSAVTHPSALVLDGGFHSVGDPTIVGVIINTGSYSYNLPHNRGTLNQLLVTNGDGTTHWMDYTTMPLPGVVKKSGSSTANHICMWYGTDIYIQDAGIYMNGSTLNLNGNTLFTTSYATIYGINCLGDLFVSGTKSFRIPHPTLPSLDLLHASCEGDERYLMYKGVAHCKEEVEIVLPDYFWDINKDVTVQTTPINSLSMTTYRIDGKHIYVKASNECDVSWAVYGIRDDAYSRQNPFISVLPSIVNKLIVEAMEVKNDREED